MEPKRYFVDKGCISTGKKFAPSQYDSMYVLSPEKIFLFYLSGDNKYGAAWAGGGGAIGGIIYALIKGLKSRKINTKAAADITELPPDITVKIPLYNQLQVIHRESVARIKTSWVRLEIKLRNGEWFSITLPITNIKRKRILKEYLKATHWV